MGILQFSERRSILIHSVNNRIQSDQFAQSECERAASRAKVRPCATRSQIRRSQKIDMIVVVHGGMVSYRPCNVTIPMPHYAIAIFVF
jgi:hypothetical protein